MTRTTRTTPTVPLPLHRRLAFPLAAGLFLLAPAPARAWFHGVPLGAWPLALAAVVGVAWGLSRKEDAAPRLQRAALCLAALAAVKVVLFLVTPTTGWLGRYYPNGEFRGAPRRSTEFARLVDATRVDGAIDFHDDYLPLYFLNEADFNRGIRREVTEPVSVWWSGVVTPDAPMSWPLSVETRGPITVAVDGVTVLASAAGRASAPVALSAGRHVVDVRYVKPANTDPLVRVVAPPVAVTPSAAVVSAPTGTLQAVARAVDVLALAALVAAMWTMARATAWSRVVAAAALMFALLLAQGLVKAAPFDHRAVTLSGGDDWLAYEARSREVALGDVSLSYGQPRGHGEAFYYYPGYIYFLAGVHAFVGEDLSALVLGHFLLLFAANVVVYWLARHLFGARAALWGVAGVLLVEQLDFVRYYTVTLLSENLYVLTASATLYLLARFASEGGWGRLAACGVAAGVSALTRPAMMIYLGPGALVVGATAWLRDVSAGRLARAVGAVALFVAVWLLALTPATVRNYVVAGAPVLIANAPVAGFINYNVPPQVDAKTYRDRYDGRLSTTVGIVWELVTRYPGAMLRATAVKIGFSLGFLQLMGGRMHPELVLASVGYLLAIALCPLARGVPTWPVHAFVVAHLAGMAITMPSNYGYRLILPLYLFFPLFGAALVDRLVPARWAL